MNLESCHTPAWAPSNPPPNSAWAAATRIRGQLCRLCDLALEAKDGGRLLRFRRHEFKIVRALHADFGRLDLHTAHCTSATECDICRLVRAAKRMALSEYADEFTSFIRETREAKGGTVTRVTHDFTDDFRHYLMRAGLPEHSKARQLMERAELVSQYLSIQTDDTRAQPENIAPARIRIIADYPDPILEESDTFTGIGHPKSELAQIADDMSEICRQINVMRGKHLCIIR